MAVEVLKQNRDAVIATDGYRPLQVSGTIDGVEYTVGLWWGGHIRQLYQGPPLGGRQP